MIAGDESATEAEEPVEVDDDVIDVSEAEAEAAESADADDETDVGIDVGEISEEAVVALIAERDEYLDALQRLKADFANARRRTDEQAATQRGQAAADLVTRLLPILDSCEAALGQGIEEVRPISDALFDVLAGQGLTRVDAVGAPFDPEMHEAVMYEQGDGEQVVAEMLRTGYKLNERVLRAAMVKVQG